MLVGVRKPLIFTLKTRVEGFGGPRRNGSMVKNAGYSCRGPRFPPSTSSSSQPPRTPVPEDLTPPSDFQGHRTGTDR